MGKIESLILLGICLGLLMYREKIAKRKEYEWELLINYFLQIAICILSLKIALFYKH